MAKGKIALALGFPKSESEDDSDDDVVDTKSKKADPQGKAEVMAMRAFMRGTTAEEKASSMRDFLEACGVY